MAPAEIAKLYRLRWEVETFYKTGKSGLGLDEITSRKPHIVRILVKGALVRSTIAMQAKCEAENNLPAGQWINPLEWVQVWRVAVEAVLLALVGHGSRDPASGHSWSFLAALARDPNVKRPPTRWSCLHEPDRSTA